MALSPPKTMMDCKDEESMNSQVGDSAASSDRERTGSSGHSTTSATPSKEESEEKLDLAKKETTAVFRLRLLVFFVLLLAAVAVSVIVFFIMANQESDEYTDEFSAASKKVIEAFLDIAETKIGAVSSLGVALVAHGVDYHSEWPFVTLSSFQQRATSAMSQSGAFYISMNPLVQESQREQWEKYVIGENSLWIDDGLDYQDYDGVLNFTEGVLIEEDHINKTIDKSEPWPIWYYEAVYGEDGSVWNHTKVTDHGPGPYLPTWQVSPILEGGLTTNENILRTEHGVYGTKPALENESVVISRFQHAPAGGILSPNKDTALYSLLLSAKNDVEEDPIEYAGDPISEIFFPIFNSFDVANREPVGVMVASIQWMSYFRDILPDSMHGIYFVLSDSCGGQFTFEIKGSNVFLIGEGDLHNPAFRGMRSRASFKDVATIGDGTKRGVPLYHDGCDIEIEVYPSHVFEDRYKSSTPVIMTAGVAIIFSFTALMFLFYDRLVERRQALVMQKAAQTNAIVSSLFPEQVRDRLMQQASYQAEETMGKPKSGEFLAPTRRLKGYLNGGEDDDMNQAPIADLFPHCTVLFADIAGFTAWSSTRDPAQVFILLQTVYQAFDKIAKRRKVFKVETIGDSYVAVTGLPEPQSRHAVIMARFAGECKLKMNELVAQLENSLGPDTGDLAMRFGLNSGPVTAGVLRGERARFQLFGDTVNTAARMESTGYKDQIQCSISTYSKLLEAGKEKWLTPRADPVQAKGKGFLKTFWIDVTSKRGSSANSSNSDDGDGDSAASSNATSLAAQLSRPKTAAASMKQDRLVNWIVDMLHEHIRKVVALRRPESKGQKPPIYIQREDQPVLEEVAEVIFLPKFDERAFSEAKDHRSIDVGPDVISQLRKYVSIIANWYHDNPFHNFEHACHVTMATNKFLKRIVSPDVGADKGSKVGDIAAKIHQYTHGINSDPLTVLAIVFSALIHDADHRGVSNTQLAKEDKDLGEKYGNKSIAEQNSFDIAWDLLMKDDFADLRACLFTNEAELHRFRQVLVNVVLATDIFDRELNGLRKKRWEKAFSQSGLKDDAYDDLRATIVIEHIIQASDVSHTMQHWHIYRKWNKKLFQELYFAYLEGRMEKDPSTFWYHGEIGFFDNYIIPLAKKLKDCNVFGVSSDECLNYALQNRDEWKEHGKSIVQEMVEELAGMERTQQAKAALEAAAAIPEPLPEPEPEKAPTPIPKPAGPEMVPMPMTKEQAAEAEVEQNIPEVVDLPATKIVEVPEAEEEIPAGMFPEKAPLPMTKEQADTEEAPAERIA